MKYKKNAILIVFALCAILLAACDRNNPSASATPTVSAASADEPVRSEGVIAEGHIQPGEFRYLTFSQPGRVGDVLVNKGDLVSEGDVLATIAGGEQAQAALDAALLEVENAQQSIDALKRTAALAHANAWAELLTADRAVIDAQRAWDAIDVEATQDDIEQAKVDVAKAEKELEDAQKEYDRYKDLPDDNADKKKAKTDLDDAQKKYDDAVIIRDELMNAFDQAKARLEQAIEAQKEVQRNFNQTKDGPDPDQLILAELRLTVANSTQTAAQAALDDLLIKAPFSGQVLDVNIIQGEQASPANWAVLLADTSQWYVQTSDLTELEVVKIKPGQIVSITPDALPDLVLTGIVDEISNVFRTQTGDILYDVKIKLNGFDERLKWGMTVEADFSEK